MPDCTTARDTIRALRSVHERLSSLAYTLSGDGPTAQSKARDWSLAQVFSHLGSGAEITLGWLNAALEGRDRMLQETMQGIWAAWDAMAPAQQVSRSVTADAILVSAFETLSDSELAGAGISLFDGMPPFDGGGLALFRLPEAALHAWDIDAALHPGASVTEVAVPLLVDALPHLHWLGKPQPRPATLKVRTSAPERELVISTGPEGTRLAAGGPTGHHDGTLELPSEVLIRLTYGRSVPADAAAIQLSAESLTLRDLATAYPGL